MDNLKFSALRGLASLMIILAYIFIIGGLLSGIIISATLDYGLAVGLPVLGSGLGIGFGLLVSGQSLELQLGIYDQLAAQTKLLKMLAAQGLQQLDKK